MTQNASDAQAQTTIGASEHTIERIDWSTPWRKYVGELTDKQREQFEWLEERFRQAGTLDDEESQRALLEYTVEAVNGNRIDADYAHVQVPPGVTVKAGDGWERNLDYPNISYSRALVWRDDIETGIEGVGLDISGRQATDGSFTRHINVYADYPQLTADDARRFAAALTAAADELDRLQ